MTRSAEGQGPCRSRVVGGILVLVCLLVAGLVGTDAPLLAAESKAEQDVQWGVKMARRGLWSEAMFRFREASRFEPNDPRILNNLAVSLEAVGMFDEALEVYQRALKLDSTSRDLRQNYSRFVEFYQAFKGPEEQAEADEVPDQAQGAELEAPGDTNLPDAPAGDDASGS